MEEYVVSDYALHALESGGDIGLSDFGSDGYRMIMHDALDDEFCNPGEGWQWSGHSWWYPLREIVRCRDCRFYDNRHGECSELQCRECWTQFKPEPDGFCAWGERKES